MQLVLSKHAHIIAILTMKSLYQISKSHAMYCIKSSS
jgi:hypothetical protein